MAADTRQEPDMAFNDCVADAPEDAVSTTEGGSPSTLSAIPEETGSDFSGHIQQLTLAALHEIQRAEDLALELEA
eukprot:7705019-Pyramimonas_sp.AAC.1